MRLLSRLRPHRIRRTGDDTPAGGLAAYVWRMSGRHQVAVCVLAGMVAGLSVVPVDLQRRLVDEAIGGREPILLVWLGGIYLGVVVVQAGLKYALKIYQGWLSESAIRHTRDHLTGLLAARGSPPLAGDDRSADRGTDRRAAAHSDADQDDADPETDDTADDGKPDGDAVTIVGPEVEKVGGFVGTGFSNPVTHAGMAVAILGYMVVVQPIVALISMALLVPQLAVAPILQRRVNALVERRVPLMRELGDRVAEGGERIAPDEMAPHLDRVFRNRMAIHAVKFLLKGLINLANNLAPLAVLVVGGWFVLEGRTTVGVVVAFVSGFERLGDPLRELVSWYRTASRTRIQHALIARWMTGG